MSEDTVRRRGCIRQETIIRKTAAINAERIDPVAGTVRLPNGLTVFVDPEDVPLISQHVWQACKSHRTNYARGGSCRKGTRVLMHNLIFGVRDGYRVDHKDGNGLNNRRSNLRWATRAQNAANNSGGVRGRSKFWGVSGGWVATIAHNNKRIRIGVFATEEEAARAYDEAAKKYHGEFARLNFPETT